MMPPQFILEGSVAENHERIGDWEGDTVWGQVGRATLVTLVDRKSRFLLSKRVATAKSAKVSMAIVELWVN